MACNECTQQEPCTSNDCSCPIIDFPTSCIKYTGPDLECSEITSGQNFDEVLQQLDQFICDKVNFVAQTGNLINVGTGAIIYAGNNLAGQKQLKTIVSENLNLLDIIENASTIGIQPGTYAITIDGSDIVLSITTLAGTTEVSRQPLGIASDTYVVSGAYANEVLTLTLSDATTVTIPLVVAGTDTYSVSGAYNANNIRITLNDSSFFDIDVSGIITDAQTQSNYTEEDPLEPSHILNRNPTKTITTNYSVIPSDNNFVIEVNNGVNNIIIDFSLVTATNNFFVGFIQKGTGDVTFIGADIVPTDFTNVLYGQGHAAAMEVITSTKYLLGNLKAV